ncbi:MAG: hypothetical protein KC431_26240, partial [Myxococcales bacterium]|nr:hypothetical protein [Myxococcales bacterium]
AFCVALWEGLYGQRPFIGDNIIALSDSIIEGRRRPAPTDKGVPLWLQDILIRGLHPDPPARWPSMRSLLDALAVDPQERRRRLLRNLGVAGLTSIALVGLTLAAVGGANDSARRGYWNLVTGSLLEIEQDRGLAQAVDDAMRARDATRVSASRRFIPSSETAKQEDPTMAAALLREVEGPAGESETWLSMANEVLGGPLSQAILRGHQNLVTKLVFSADGQVLYSGSSDGEVWRWQLDSGRGEKIIEHEGEVTGLALGGGETLYSVGKDGWARSWSPAAGSAQLFWSEAPLTHVDIDPRGGRILLAGKDGVVRSVALADPQDVVDFVGHRGAVRVARHSPSGTYVASGADDNSLRLWRSTDGAPVAVLEGHESGVFHLHFIDEDTLVSGADDGTVRLWRLKGTELLSSEVLGRHDKEITNLVVAGRRIGASSIDGAVSTADLDVADSWRLVDRHPKRVWGLSFAGGGELLVSGSYDTSARVHDVAGPRARASTVLLGHRESIYGLAVDESGRWLATGAWDGEIRIWDLQRPLLAQPLAGHEAPVIAVDVDASGRRAMTASHDGSVRIWDAIEGRPLARFDGGSPIGAAALSPDGELVAAVVDRRNLDLWSVEDGERRNLGSHDLLILQVRFDATGHRVASVSSDGTARIWDVDAEQGSEPLILRGHEGVVASFEFGPGSKVASAGQDGTVRVWDGRDGAALAVLERHGGPVQTLAWSPAGEVLASGA